MGARKLYPRQMTQVRCNGQLGSGNTAGELNNPAVRRNCQ
jgi:hypothetical protein